MLAKNLIIFPELTDQWLWRRSRSTKSQRKW